MASTRPMALVVDDDRLQRELCMSLLREEGFDCQPAESGKDAIEMLESRPFSLLVCDLLMPHPDGRVVIEHARKAQSPPGILVLTAMKDTEEAMKELRAAGYPILVKPLDPVRLGRAVAWVMHARHLASGGFSRGQLEALYRMATMANSEPNLTQVLDGLLGICIDALGSDSGSIMLATGTKPRVLSIAASSGLLLRGDWPPVPFGERVAGWVAVNQRALRLVGRLDAYPQFTGLASNPAIAESMIAPIVFRREILGTVSINATTPNRLGPEKLALVVSAGDIAGAAIHRNRLEHAREHQDRLAVLGQLSASLAHELNNPLAYINANVAALTDLLLGSVSSEMRVVDLRNELSELLRDINDGTQRMMSLTQNLKSAARKSAASLEAFDINNLLRRAEILVQPQFKHRLKFAVEVSTRLEVLGDAGRILQVVINLLVNAAQAVEKNGHVVLRARTEKDWAIVEVEDNGPGIPPEVAAQLFEPFFTTKPEGEGTGLGLNISRQIAVEHGGDLTFTSEIGKGTCFRLRLPAKGKDEVLSRRPLVLVVDDEPALLRAMARVLEKDFDVLSASTAAEALQLVAGKKLDLILTDYSMPLQNGVSLIRELRSQGHEAAAALVTAVAENSDIAESMKDRVVSLVIPKPWSPKALVSEALRLVRGK